MSQTIAWFAWTAGALLGLTGALLIALGLFADRARGRRRCPACWYDMTSLPGRVCPECGRASATERHLTRTRRRRRPMLAGCLVALAGVGVAAIPLALRDPWSRVPTPVLLMILPWFEEQADALYAQSPFGVAQTASRWERLLVASACARKIRERAAAHEDESANGAGLFYDAQLHQAMHALTTLGADARPGVPAVMRAMTSRSPRVRAEAAVTLGRIRPVAMSTIRALSRRVDDPAPSVRTAATAALISIAPDPRIRLPRLLDALERVAQTDPDFFQKVWAAGAIRKLEPADGARRRLVGLLAAADHDTRVAGARALESMGPDALPALAAIARATGDGSARLAATGVSVLESFGAPAANDLSTLADHADPEVARPAIQSLGGLGPAAAPAVPALIRALEHTDGRVRSAAVRAIASIGPTAWVALPALERMATVEDEPIAAEARAAIGAISGR